MEIQLEEWQMAGDIPAGSLDSSLTRSLCPANAAALARLALWHHACPTATGCPAYTCNMTGALPPFVQIDVKVVLTSSRMVL